MITATAVDPSSIPTRAGISFDTNSDNHRVAIATLVGSARATVSPIERALANALLSKLNIPPFTWQRAVTALRQSRKAFGRTPFTGLLRGDKLATVMRASTTDANIRAVVRLIHNWATASAAPGNVACRACGAGVAAGIECSACAHSWHFGCAWKELDDKQRTRLIPPKAWFQPQGSEGVTRFKCLLCIESGRAPRTVRGSLLDRFKDFVDTIQVNEAWDLLHRALDVGGPTRRWLPGSRRSRGGANSSRYLATAAISILATATEAGDRSAELILLFAPRFFMRKGKGIDEQLAELIDGRISYTETPPPANPEARWAAAVEGALLARCIRKLVDILEQGPRQHQKTSVDTTSIHNHFPQQHHHGDEITKWQDLRASIPAKRTGFAAVDLKKWTRKHATSSGGSCGWTGALLQHVDKSDPHVGAHVARLLARPPDHWNFGDVARMAFRSTDGWLIPKPTGVERRPIAAPQLPRKVGSATLMARARPATDRYCRSRWQFGLSGDAHNIAYSMIPLLACATGGSVLVADRSQSFQTIKREAVLAAVTDLVEHALPTETEAVAALVDACLEYYVRTPLLNKTTVDFEGIAETFVVDGLPQGCTLSPTLEAVTIAWLQHNAGKPVDGVCRLTAHDDMVVVGGKLAPHANFDIPPCDPIGGAYNTAKSIAYGASADALVQAGKAATTEPLGTIWGRPVGDIARWWAERWLPRFRKRCERIAHLAKSNAAVAIWSAHALRGPGGMAMHALRGLPPRFLSDKTLGSEQIMRVLEHADDTWVDLLHDLAGSAAPPRQSPMRAHAHQLIFGHRMGHLSAAACAPKAATAGLAEAFPAMMRIANAHKLDPADWAELLDLPQLAQYAGRAVPAAVINSCKGTLTAAAKLAAEQWDAKRSPSCDTNLWVEALTAPGPLHAAVDAACGAAMLPTTRDAAIQFALARALQTPVWGALTAIAPDAHLFDPTAACGLCGTAPSNAAQGFVDGSARPVAAPRRPRQHFDVHALHVSACLRATPAVNNKTRHDRLVKVAVELGHLCGISSRFHDGPLFDIDSSHRGKRPADWLEQNGEITPAESSRYFLGRCHDLTYVTGDAEAAELRKHVKYKAAMAELPNHALSILAVNYDGDVSRGGMEVIRRWATNLTRLRKLSAELTGSPAKEVTSALATGFATVTALQVAAYVNEVSGPRKKDSAHLNRRATQDQGGPPAKRHCIPPQESFAGTSGQTALANGRDSCSTAITLTRDSGAVTGQDQPSPISNFLLL